MLRSIVLGMAKVTPPRPTDAELEILQVLWTKGPCTVREVHEELNQARATGYTTVLKLMQIMGEKRLVRRNEDQRAHVYEAMLPQKTTQRQLVRDLVERAFRGSAAGLVMQALAAKPATREELQQIRELLDSYERGKR
jgi:predicted transcriptional regulator